jgi:hypothetical protein
VSERAAPFYCPYCGDEDLRPSEAGHGAWECAACARAFQLKFLGLLAESLRETTHQGPDTREGGTVSDARAAAGPQTTTMPAPLRRTGGEANKGGTE